MRILIDAPFYDNISFLATIATIYGNSIRVQTLMTEKILDGLVFGKIV